MSAKLYGISKTEITWEKSKTQISYDDTNKVTISVVGSVGNEDDSVSLEAAIKLLPAFIPISSSGPIGNSTRYAGAGLVGPSARYLGDGTIEVEADYRTADPLLPSGVGGGTPDNVSDSDRAERQIVSEEVPLLAHPLVEEFPDNDRVKLRALQAGEVVPNPTYDSEGSGSAAWEFIRYVDQEMEEVNFDDADVTNDGVTASPLDYARLIASGVEVYRRPAIRHILSMNRDFPGSNAEYNAVAEIINSNPKFAPTLAQGRQWFLNGISDITSDGIHWSRTYEFEATGPGGGLKAIYKNGNKEIE